MNIIASSGFDGLIVRGEVDIRLYQGETEVNRVYEPNLVVDLGKTNVAKLLGGDAAGKAVTKFGVGTNAVSAAVGDVGLTGMFSKSIDSVSYPDSRSVMFHFDLDNGEANGISIREFGLLNDSNVLFARKVREAAIVKTNLIRLVGTWKITIN
ncbi:hypothetical protein LZZ85_11480 [Terrimonas sp. NA20]|uniref:Uncharacterized protein n=1 Tax=Terrimonas ginsenosidimutans TaxID=2908004 RepID=A0ABS9KRL3_9BACT|nr:hypothetical protein [Terrimonas ginsenosidimutans]MCG2614910.1 hypothetical protein [Terrimonas ginsenosidimutans]